LDLFELFLFELLQFKGSLFEDLLEVHFLLQFFFFLFLQQILLICLLLEVLLLFGELMHTGIGFEFE
jgi:hypothetical protein